MGNGPSSTRACFECGGDDHWVAECPLRKHGRRFPGAPLRQHAQPGDVVRGVDVGIGGDQTVGTVIGVDAQGIATVQFAGSMKKMSFQTNVGEDLAPGTDAQHQAAVQLWRRALDAAGKAQRRELVANTMEAWLQKAVTRREATFLLAFLGYDMRPIGAVKHYTCSVGAVTINDGRVTQRVDAAIAGHIDELMHYSYESSAFNVAQGNLGQQLDALGSTLADLEALDDEG